MKMYFKIYFFIVYVFKTPSEEISIIKWEKFCTNELFIKQETESRETIKFKVDDCKEK